MVFAFVIADLRLVERVHVEVDEDLAEVQLRPHASRAARRRS